jgi:hypothetical protein
MTITQPAGTRPRADTRRVPAEADIRRVPAGDSRRVFAVSGLIVTPLAYVATLLLAMGAGAKNAALIALVPALFAAGFFCGLYWLAVVVKRDERRSLRSHAAHYWGRLRGSRPA